MPQVELIGPNRMNIKGHVFIKGEPEDVDMEMAFALRDNPRFKVTGLDTRAAVEFQEMERRPAGAGLFAAILEAQDRLDIDDDASFDRLGQPAVPALSALLGYPVSREERDAALKAAPKVVHGDDARGEKSAPSEVADFAAARVAGTPITIKKRPVVEPAAPADVEEEAGVQV